MSLKFKKGAGLILAKLCLVPFLFIFLLVNISGCTPASYPEERAVQNLQEILNKEYKIPNAEVQFSGKTLGVFLPLDQLFALDFKEALMSGKVADLESLFRPTDAAIDKVEDVLFSMSRVMLSTDKKIDFYYLQATDVEKTGMELMFIGHIDDIKRVRFWDIPRSEYRKRIIHDIRLNRAVLWDKPVRSFFHDLDKATADIIQSRYFPNTDRKKWTDEFLFVDASGNPAVAGQAQWKILELRSIPIQDNETVVYAKVEATSKNVKAPEFQPKILEYLFHISLKENEEKIRRIIPLVYLEESSQEAGLPFTKKMVYESLPNWETEFKAPDIQMEDFLTRQLTRRLQEIVSQDERIYNTFSSIKLIFRYEKQPGPYFLFNATTTLRTPATGMGAGKQGIHEDVLYLWELAAREFVEVLRSYNFKNYQGLQFQETQTGKLLTWTATKEDLELFRQHKKDLQSILTLSR